MHCLNHALDKAQTKEKEKLICRNKKVGQSPALPLNYERDETLRMSLSS